MSTTLDSIDRRILKELQRDGRLSNSDLADRVGLSPTPVWRRVKRLEESGVIQGYVALVNPAALGFNEMVFVELTISGHSETIQKQFAQAVKGIPEVLAAHFISGNSDFLLQVVTGGTGDYHRLLIESLYRLPGVQDVRSSFVLKTIKDVRQLPVEQ